MIRPAKKSTLMDATQIASELYYTMARKVKTEEMRDSLLQRARDMEQYTITERTKSLSAKASTASRMYPYPSRFMIMWLFLLLFLTTTICTWGMVFAIKYLYTALYEKLNSNVLEKQVELQMDRVNDQFHSYGVVSTVPAAEASSSLSTKNTCSIIVILWLLWAIYTNYITAAEGTVITVVYTVVCLFGVLLYHVLQRNFCTINAKDEMMTVLLDPMQHHMNMREFFDASFMYFTDTATCIQYINSHKRLEISLFLSVDHCRTILAKLLRYHHVVLYIFYNEVFTQAQKNQYSDNERIRFMFHESELREYLRHTMIINYSRCANAFRQLGFLQQADEYYWAARQQCIALGKELERKIDTQIANDAQDLSIMDQFNETAIHPFII